MGPFLVLIFLFHLSDAKFEDPGIKGRMTLKGFQYGWQAGVEDLKTRLSSLHIPDVHGTFSVPVLSNIYYLVNRIQIKDLDLSQSDVSLSANTGVQLVINRGQIRIAGHLTIKTVLFEASAGVELLITDLSLSGVLGLTRDDLGHGGVWNAGCSSNAGHVDIQFHGGAGWLFRMFRGAMLGPIHDALSKHLCPEFDEAVMRLEGIISNLPGNPPSYVARHLLCESVEDPVGVPRDRDMEGLKGRELDKDHTEASMLVICHLRGAIDIKRGFTCGIFSQPVDSVAAIEVPLVAPPLVNENNLELAVKGQFVGLTQRWEPPYTPEKLVLPDLDSRMLLLALSQFSANSAGYVHYKAGALRSNVTDDMIPKISPLRLNIKGLAMFAPELPQRFPDSPPLLLQVSARSPPSLSFLEDSLTLQVSADIRLFAMYPERPLDPLFQLQADGEFQVDIVLSEESVGASLTSR
ncbi:bactericidal permeability-increasing protein-like, partial [Discoglossus pictus]